MRMLLAAGLLGMVVLAAPAMHTGPQTVVRAEVVDRPPPGPRGVVQL